MERVFAAKDWWRERVGFSKVNDGGLWEGGVGDRTCVVVKTGHEVARGRLGKLLRRGWMSVGRKVGNVVGVGDGFDGVVGVVGMREYGMGLLEGDGGVVGNASFEKGGMGVPKKWFGKGGWRGDKDKNLPAFHLARRLWDGCEWFVMLDDDTYFLAENFAEWAVRKEREMKGVGLYTGKVFYVSSCVGWNRGKETKGRRNPTFAHGGSGIVMNRKAMDFAYPRFGDCIRNFTGCWAGDMQVGLCLREGGIVPPKYGNRTYEKHFTPFSPGRSLMDSRYNSRWQSTERPISFHKLPDHELDAMSEYERKCIKEKKPVVYRELKQWLASKGIDGKDYTENEKKRLRDASKQKAAPPQSAKTHHH